MHLHPAANAVLVSIVVAAAAPAAGQAAAPARPAFTDLFVTDGDGKPVPGLRAAELEVLDDGTPVPVLSCVAPRQARGAPPEQLARARRLLLALVVDDAMTREQRAAVFASAGGALRELLGGDGSRVMVASGGAALAVRQPFTADVDLLVRTLDRMRAAGGGDPGPASPPGGRAPADVAALLDSLGVLPGRRAVVLVAGAAPAPRESVAAPDPLGTLVEKANAAGVTVYSIGVPGAGSDGGAGAAAGDGGAGEFAAVAARAAPRTAGLALTEGDSSGALAAVVRDLAGAWSVAFVPTPRGDGARHRLEVRVKRAGVTVRARPGFVEADGDGRMSDRTLAALLLGFEDNPLGIQVSATSEPRPKDGTQVVSVLVTVPLGSVEFEPRAVSHDCDLSIWLVARDGDGQVIRAPKAKFPVSVPNERLLTALTQTAGYTFRVPMRPGPAAVAVTVRDEIGAQTSTTVATVAPPPDATQGVTP